MKHLFGATFLALAAIHPAIADGEHLGADWISLPDAMVRAYALGFSELTEIEAEQGVWKVKGFRGGVYTKIALDPRTGVVVPLPSKKHRRRHDD